MSDRDLNQAPCGFGYDGSCCCTCGHQLIAKPRCHHLGGIGKCGSELIGAGPLKQLADEGVDGETSYVCMLFASDGIAMTDWLLHGCCECHYPRGSIMERDDSDT